jgi:hypothetical protein
MASPLRAVHVYLAAEQVSHLGIEAARRHLSMSALIRELVELDRGRKQAAERRLRRKETSPLG